LSEHQHDPKRERRGKDGVNGNVSRELLKRKGDGSESAPLAELTRSSQKDRLLGAISVHSGPVPPEPTLTVPPLPSLMELLVEMVTMASDFVA